MNVGNNPVEVVVTAGDGETTAKYTVNVLRQASSDSSESETSSSANVNPGSLSPAVKPADGFAVIVNGQKQQIATATTEKQGNTEVIKATVVESDLKAELAKQGQNALVVVPVTASADKTSAVLTGQSIKDLEHKSAVLRIETPIGSYDVPANLVAIDKVSAQLGSSTSLSNITVSVNILKSAADKITGMEHAGQRQGFTLASAPIDFTIEAAYDGKTVEVDKFDSYVQREIAIPEGVDPNKITTAVVLNSNGTVHHVPTAVTVRDGKYFATINSLTNSTYSLIYNQKTFTDVREHWAQDSVEDMASRLVVTGTDDTHFNPNASITRAEFAAIVVRGLGLAEDKTTDKFEDVKAGDWYSGAVQKSVEYSLIEGYENGTFRPNTTITREEALVLVSRAIEVAHKEAATDGTQFSLDKFKDKAEVSEWASKDVAKTAAIGLAQGTGENLEPKANMTRAETATVIQRLLSKFKLINSKK